MYAIIALILVGAFVLTTVGLPLRLDRVYERVRPGMGRAARWLSGQAVLPSFDESERETMTLARAWLLLSALGFTVLGIADGTLVRDHPEALRSIAGCGVVACGLSGLLISYVFACKRLVNRAGLETTFRRCGIRGLWILGSRRRQRRLVSYLHEQASRCSRIRILDVIGHDIVVKPDNTIQRALRDVLQEHTDVPVELLLLDPMARQKDPDRRPATVFQTTRAELQTQSSVYVRQLRETLAALETLNEQRPPESPIIVRYYDQKPTLRAIIFDESILILPFGPGTRSKQLSCLAVQRDSDATSLHETFRHEFARLWQGSLATVFTA